MNKEIENLLLFDSSYKFFLDLYEKNFIKLDELQEAKKLLLEIYPSKLNNLTN